MFLILLILGIVLVVGGIVAALRGAVLLGIVAVVVGVLLLGYSGVDNANAQAGRDPARTIWCC